jgi:hypothetical protein
MDFQALINVQYVKITFLFSPVNDRVGSGMQGRQMSCDHGKSERKMFPETMIIISI